MITESVMTLCDTKPHSVSQWLLESMNEHRSTCVSICSCCCGTKGQTQSYRTRTATITHSRYCPAIMRLRAYWCVHNKPDVECDSTIVKHKCESIHGGACGRERNRIPKNRLNSFNWMFNDLLQNADVFPWILFNVNVKNRSFEKYMNFTLSCISFMGFCLMEIIAFEVWNDLLSNFAQKSIPRFIKMRKQVEFAQTKVACC